MATCAAGVPALQSLPRAPHPRPAQRAPPLHIHVPSFPPGPPPGSSRPSEALWSSSPGRPLVGDGPQLCPVRLAQSRMRAPSPKLTHGHGMRNRLPGVTAGPEGPARAVVLSAARHIPSPQASPRAPAMNWAVRPWAGCAGPPPGPCATSARGTRAGASAAARGPRQALSSHGRRSPRTHSGAWADSPGGGQLPRGTPPLPLPRLGSSSVGVQPGPGSLWSFPRAFRWLWFCLEPGLQSAAHPPSTDARQALSTVRELQTLRRADPSSPAPEAA